MKPWEQNYASAQQGEESNNPWEQEYDTGSDLTMSAMPDRTIVEEMHPAVSWKDRALIKNFSTDQMTGVKYLQNKYPNLQVELSPENRILMKGKNEKEWRTLDPDAEGFDGFAELGMDIADIGYDVAAGIGEGAATAAAGVGAGLASGGAAAIPAAMAAGAGSSATLEYLRQKLGQAGGLPQETDMEQVGTSAAFGAVSPLLLGTGGTIAKGAAKKSLMESGKEVTKESVEQLVKSQRGTFEKTYKYMKDSILPKAAEVTSGVKSKNYSTYLKNIDAMKDWSSNPSKFTDYVRKVGMGMEEAINKNVKNAGDEMGAILEQYAPNLQVDVRDFYAQLNQEATDLINSQWKDDNALGQKMRGLLKDLFVESKSGKLRTTLDFDNAKMLRDKFKKLNKSFNANLTGDPHRDAMIEIGDRGYRAIQDMIDGSLDKVEQGAGDVFARARARYREALTLKEQADSNIFKEIKKTGQKDYSKTLATLRTLDNDTKVMMRDTLTKIDPKITEKADIAEAFIALNNPSWFPTSGTSTSTSRTISMGTIGAGVGAMSGEGGLGGQYGAMAGIGVGLLGLSPKAWRAYFKMGRAGEEAIKGAFRKAGKPVPRNLKKYYNRQMAIQSGKNMLRKRGEEEQR
jgi:hypothetical protein